MQFGETGHVGFEEEKDDILAMGAVSVGCTAIKLHKLTCDNGWRFRGIRLTSAGRSRTMNILRQPAPLHVRQQRVFVVVKVGGQLHPVPAKLCDEELDQGSEAPVVSEADHNRLPGAQQQQSALPPYPQSPTSRPQQQACSWYLLLPASELSRRWGMAPHAGDAICGLDTYVAEGPAGGGPGGGGGGGEVDDGRVLRGYIVHLQAAQQPQQQPQESQQLQQQQGSGSKTRRAGAARGGAGGNRGDCSTTGEGGCGSSGSSSGCGRGGSCCSRLGHARAG